MSTSSRASAVGVTLLALVVFAVGRFVPVPGIDTALVLDLLHPLSPWSASEVSLFGVALLPLVLVSVVLELVSSADPAIAARRRRVGAVAFLLLCAATGYLRAVSVEAYGHGPFGSGTFVGLHDLPLVIEPGLRFRAIAVLTWVTAGAVLWLLSGWVTRRGLANGALLFAGAVVLGMDLDELREALARLLGDDPNPTYPLVWFAPWIVVLFGLWRFAPEQWPVRVARQAALRTPLDAVLAPAAAGFVAGDSGVLAVFGSPEALTAIVEPRVISLIVSSAVAVAVVVALRAQAKRRGSVGFLLVGVLAPLPALALSVAPMVVAVRKHLEPGPFAGAGAFEVVLRCADAKEGVVAHDAPVIERRLAEYKVDADVIAKDGERLQVRLRGVRDASEVLAAVAPPWRLAFHVVADRTPLPELSPDVLAQRGVSVDDDGSPGLVAADREALEEVVQALRAPEGTQFGIECGFDSYRGRERCVARLIEAPSALEGHVADAEVHQNDWGGVEVALQFDPEGARTFEEVTANAVGRKLAIVLDGRVLSAPVIQQRISGGHARITLGRASSPERELGEAQRLAKALETGPLSCRWMTESVQLAK